MQEPLVHLVYKLGYKSKQEWFLYGYRFHNHIKDRFLKFQIISI
jgi:hypothetical protein